jgi:hypothetical protein
VTDREAYRAHVIAERDRLRAEARTFEWEIARLNAEDAAAAVAAQAAEAGRQVAEEREG